MGNNVRCELFSLFSFFPFFSPFLLPSLLSFSSSLPSFLLLCPLFFLFFALFSLFFSLFSFYLCPLLWLSRAPFIEFRTTPPHLAITRKFKQTVNERRLSDL
ncbi:hypothetical protein LINPERHAP2_LOCUS30418, partial [Linum perenne]